MSTTQENYLKMSVDELMKLDLGAGAQPEAQLRNLIVNFKLQKSLVRGTWILVWATWALAIATVILSFLTTTNSAA